MTNKPEAHRDLSVSGGIEPVSPPRSRLLRLPEVMDRVGLRRASIYQRMNEGRFPKSRSLGAKCSVWVESEIDAWIEEVIGSQVPSDS